MKMKEKVRKETIKPYYFLSTLSCIIILMFIVIVPANAGVRPDVGRSIGDATNGTVAIIGETNLRFVNASGVPISEGIIKSNWENSNINIPFDGPFDSSDYKDELVSGEYKVIGISNETIIYFRSPKLDVKTEIGGEKVTKVTKGDDINFTATTELNFIKGPRSNYITYKLIGPDGAQVTEVSGVSLININVNETGNDLTTINTATLEIGTYKLSIETDPATNNGLDIEGPSVSFAVEARDINITAEPANQTVNEDITFTVTTSPNTNIILNVTSGRASKVWFKHGIYGVVVSTDGHSASGTSDKDGIFKAVAYFTATGRYEITAKELIEDTEDTVTVNIVELGEITGVPDAELTEPEDGYTYSIGDLMIAGSSGGVGDNITIKINGAEFKKGASVNGFYYTWNTEDQSPGSHEIAIWVLPFSDPERDPPDRSVTIMLLRGGLRVDLIYTDTEGIVQEIVAQGDDFEIKGDAPGRKNVDILTIAPKGGSGRGFDPTDILTATDGTLNAPGLTHDSVSVSRVIDNVGGEITKTMIDVGKDADTGTYLIAVLNPGRDEVYGSTNSSEILTVLSNYNPSIKTQAQILAILKEETINQAGSDDLLWVGTIEVVNPWVTLNDIEDVHLGDDIEVSGVTNRKNGFLFIITVEGPTDLTPLFASTEVVSTAGGTFTASFNTISAKVGKYTVTVADGDGYTDTKTVNILPATTPSFNISGTPTPIPAAVHEGEGTNESDTAAQVATPIPTRTSTSTKTEEKKKPDFVLICIIAGAGAGILIAVSVARLVIVKRRKEGEKEEEKQGEDGTV